MKTGKNKIFNILIIIALSILSLPVLLTAEPEKNIIRTTSDKMVYNPASKYLEYVGNVEVNYQSYVIKADNLKLFLLETGSLKSDDKKNSPGKAKVDKIVATGNVNIKFDNKVATSEKAEYFVKTEDLILSGKNTKIVFDGNSFVGTRVTYNRLTENMSMEGDQNTQLKGIIYSDEVLEK